MGTEAIYCVYPRFTGGSPAQVDRETAFHVLRNELNAARDADVEPHQLRGVVLSYNDIGSVRFVRDLSEGTSWSVPLKEVTPTSPFGRGHVHDTTPKEPPKAPHRYPTDEDIERWKPLLAKLKEAQKALAEADVILGQTLLSLPGDDTRSMEIFEVYNDQIERARMAVSSIYPPVEECWAGPGAARDSRHWRF